MYHGAVFCGCQAIGVINLVCVKDSAGIGPVVKQFRFAQYGFVGIRFSLVGPVFFHAYPDKDGIISGILRPYILIPLSARL